MVEEATFGPSGLLDARKVPAAGLVVAAGSGASGVPEGGSAGREGASGALEGRESGNEDEPPPSVVNEMLRQYELGHAIR